ncbi:MAG: thioredoxin family protein [bacterium]|nr:thioredoxin family protein [bacterium]
MKRGVQFIIIASLATTMMILPSCTPSENVTNDVNKSNNASVSSNIKTSNVYFLELGSDGCTPCQMMRPVMEKVTENYKGRVEVIFYDVNTVQGGSKAQEYGIRVIPTQIFLDSQKKEIFRHEGYYPYENIKSLLDGWLE